MKRALVLSGGGSKGAYQIGVWKALRKLNFKIDIVAGTSIGALNGALIVQDDYQKALNLWNNLDFSMIFDKPIDDKNDVLVYKEYIKEFFKKGGMEIESLEKTIKNNVDTEKLYNSKIDFGLTTFKLNTLDPIMLTKKEIKKDQITDYLTASATCYPAFKQKKIEGNTYIDGGYYDNLPINLAIKMGATSIIAVDLKTIGINKKIKNFTEIDYITPNNKLGNFLVFDKEESCRQINLGYNDTMKFYNKKKGRKYTFEKINYLTNEMILLKSFKKNSLKYINPKTKIGKVMKASIYSEILLSNKIESKEKMLEALEKIMEIFSFKYDDIYTLRKVIEVINVKINDMPKLEITKIEKIINSKKPKDNKILIYLIIYINHLQMKNDINKLTLISLAFPKEYLAATFYMTAKNKHL